MFRAVVLADTPMLTVNEFPQIAAHVEGYAVTVPPAPAPKDLTPRIEGPVMLGESAGTPATIHVPQANGKDAIGIPALSDSGDIRSLEAVEADMIRLAFGRYRGQDDGDRPEARHRPLDPLPQDARDRARGETQLTASAAVWQECHARRKSLTGEWFNLASHTGEAGGEPRPNR